MSSRLIVSGQEVVKGLVRDGFIIVRQRESHIRLEKYTYSGILKVTVPDHDEISPKTLNNILEATELTREELKKLLKRK